MRWLHHALGSAALRGLLALLLLVAQHGALTHALVHVSGHAHVAPDRAAAATPANGGSRGHDHDHAHAQSPAGEGRNANSQCAFDLLYSELLGGLLLIDSVSTAGAMVPGAVTPLATSAASVTALPYRSRGPPPDRA